MSHVHVWEDPNLPAPCGWGKQKCLKCGEERTYEYGWHDWVTYEVEGHGVVTLMHECEHCGLRAVGSIRTPGTYGGPGARSLSSPLRLDAPVLNHTPDYPVGTIRPVFAQAA